MGARREQLGDAFQEAMHVERLGLEMDAPGLDLGEVENVVDQRQQRLAGIAHGLRVVALLGRQIGIEQQSGHAENAVHRRADLMAHGRQKHRLGAARGLGLVARLAQLFLDLLALGDVAPDALDLDQRARPNRGSALPAWRTSASRACLDFEIVESALDRDGGHSSAASLACAPRVVGSNLVPTSSSRVAAESAAIGAVHERDRAIRACGGSGCRSAPRRYRSAGGCRISSSAVRVPSRVTVRARLEASSA